MLKLTMTIIKVLTFTIALSACNASSLSNYPAAPLDNKQALEKLAVAYEASAETIPTNPSLLKPSARKKFVTQVFTSAGYAYTKTLVDLSKIPSTAITQYHEDMKQLLFLPHYRLKLDEIKEIYSDEELQAILTIDKNFNAR